MKPSDFDLLLDRYVDDKLSDAERRKFEAWMDVMKEHKDTNLELSKQDEQLIYQRIMNATTTPADILKFTPQVINANLQSQRSSSASATILPQRSGLQPWMRIAAVILLLITASAVLYVYRNTQASSTEVIVNTDSKKVMLNDGTLIWLERGSVLKYSEMGGGETVRNVSLTGTALFEVAKDATHPFTIAIGDMKVTVVGTSFSISTDLNVIDLKVITGKVHLSSTTDTKGVDVFPNEKISYSLQGKINIAPLDSTEVSAITQNTQYDMSFRNSAMSEVFARIEKKFDVIITLENKKMNDCRITGDFSDHSLADTLTLLSEILELEFVIKGKTVAISGAGCNEL